MTNTTTRVRRLVLDVLKPHQPSVLELGRALARQDRMNAKLTVREIDDKTETLRIEVTGANVNFEELRDAIEEFGASLHSIDEVEVESGNDSSD